MNRSRWLAVAAAVLVVAGLVVRFVGEPTLVRFPLGLDQQLQYKGTATVYVNPSTGATLASPLRLPLTVDRRIHVVSGSYSRAVVDETVAMTFGGSTRTETYQYVMDRRHMQLLDSPQSFAFGKPANVMSPAGSYRINFPLGTSQHAYTTWAPQTASTVSAVPAGGVHRDSTSGDKVLTFNTNLNHAVAPYYATYLHGLGLPAELSASTVAADLQASGVNLNEVVGALSSRLSPSQLATLTTLLSRPVPLTYSYFETGQVSVEPTTGAVINASSSREGVTVSPDLSAATQMAGFLAPYADLPAVQALNRAVGALAAPQAVFDVSYTETPASVRSAAATAANLADNMALIRWQLPVSLVGLGILLAIAAVLWRPRRHAPVRHLPGPAEAGGEQPGRQAG